VNAFRLVIASAFLTVMSLPSLARNSPAATVSSQPAAVSSQPASWSAHVVIVDLPYLSKRYTCDDLWYKFRDVLLAIGARPDLKITPYRCEAALGSRAYSPQVQLQFSLPRQLDPRDARWAQLQVVSKSVELQPGTPAHIDDQDCDLLKVMKSTLLRYVGVRIGDFHLACRAPSASKPSFELTVQALLPVGSTPGAARTVSQVNPVPGVTSVPLVRPVSQATPVRQVPHLKPREGCEFGFTERGRMCIPVSVPSHAYLSAFGDDWRCSRGYRRTGSSCQLIVVPEHGYLTDYGWECDRGYARRNSTCVAVSVPTHGFLSDTGHDWECERGYGSDGKACVTISVPKNGHLDWTGNAWACNLGFERHGSQCVAEAPEPSASGSGGLLFGARTSS